MQFLSSNQQRQNTDSASMPCSKSDLDAEALESVVHASYDDGLADAFQCNWLRPQLEQQTPTLAASVHHTPTYSRLPSSRQKSHTHTSTQARKHARARTHARTHTHTHTTDVLLYLETEKLQEFYQRIHVHQYNGKEVTVRDAVLMGTQNRT